MLTKVRQIARHQSGPFVKYEPEADCYLVLEPKAEGPLGEDTSVVHCYFLNKGEYTCVYA